MCGECVGFSVNRKTVGRTLVEILSDSQLGVGRVFGKCRVSDSDWQKAIAKVPHNHCSPIKKIACFNI